MEKEQQLEAIASELVLRAEIIKRMPRMAEDDEHNDILLNIAVDEAIQKAEEMYNYLNR